MLELVERCDPALEQRAAIDRRLDSLRAAIEKTNAECVLQAGNDLGDGRLGDAELGRGLGHAAGVHDREKNLQVAKAQATADAIFPGGGRHRKFL